MANAASESCALLIRKLDDAVRGTDPETITRDVGVALTESIESGTIDLPAHFHESRSDCYARRLLHRDPELGYSAVVMTWGPGQGTPLHDHCGMWCVEGVVHGEILVRRFDLLERDGERFRFRAVEDLRGGVGSSGALIPPQEYHVIENSRSDRHSITLHVYGGDMDHCCLYQPEDDGWHRRIRKELAFDP